MNRFLTWNNNILEFLIIVKKTILNMLCFWFIFYVGRKAYSIVFFSLAKQLLCINEDTLRVKSFSKKSHLLCLYISSLYACTFFGKKFFHSSFFVLKKSKKDRKINNCVDLSTTTETAPDIQTIIQWSREMLQKAV